VASGLVAGAVRGEDDMRNDEMKQVADHELKLEKLKIEIDRLEERISKRKSYLDSLSSEINRIEEHRDYINGARLNLINLAAFLNDMDPMNDPETVRKWLALADMIEDTSKAIEEYVRRCG
jgi:DNA repair exonuclease SbcCD ATPase subunit